MNKFLLIIVSLSLLSCQRSEFDLCGIGIVKPYYSTGLEYEGGIYRIEKTISKHYKGVKENSTGIAKIRYKVNCHGEIGDLLYEEYDMNYLPTELNDSIQSQLMFAVSNLSEWIPGKNENGKAVNSHGFLSFRIEEGSLVEILPK